MIPSFMVPHALFSTLLLAASCLIQTNTVGAAPTSTESHSLPVPSNSRGVTPSTKTPGKLRIKENTGVCETKPGVYDAAGYGDLSETESMWFWYFASRNNPDDAPLALWFNGGPGGPSMDGVFRLLGPCRITNDSSTVVDNPYTWTNNSNILFIDQPLGVGFSESHSPLNITSSQAAAVDVWRFLQVFFSDSRFSSLATRRLGIWTQSQGGHYGPAFAAYFLAQNAAIDAGKIEGIKLNLQVLGIGNGLTDPVAQWPGYLSYAASNPYQPLASESLIKNFTMQWNITGGCKDVMRSCYVTGSDFACSYAHFTCRTPMPLTLVGDRSVYDVRLPNTEVWPPDYSAWMTSAPIISKFGPDSEFSALNISVFQNFASTGDMMRNSAIELQDVINAGVRTLIFAGDADYICNYQGIEMMMDNLNTKFSAEYAQQPWSNFTVSGVVTGLYKNAGTLSYLRMFGAGHEVPASTWGGLPVGQAALEMYEQIMNDKGIGSI